MKFRILKLFGLGIIILFFVLFTWYIFSRYSYANEEPYYQINKISQNSTPSIGIIGDSWVARQKLDSLLQNELSKIGLSYRIISSGQTGARSKAIYQNLFKHEGIKYSSKFIIENKPEYCVVIAGVNDYSAHFGKKFYSFHMIQIINSLLHYEIKPIIVSLPEFDAIKTIDEMNLILKTRSIISSKINNDGELDNISTYRDFFNNELIKNKLTDSILLIDFDKVCCDYFKCKSFYDNPSHLSLLGNIKLCKIIASEIKGSEALKY